MVRPPEAPQVEERAEDPKIRIEDIVDGEAEVYYDPSTWSFTPFDQEQAEWDEQAANESEANNFCSTR